MITNERANEMLRYILGAAHNEDPAKTLRDLAGYRDVCVEDLTERFWVGTGLLAPTEDIRGLLAKLAEVVR